MERLIRVQEVAEILGIGKSTVWLWVKLGKIPAPIHLSTRVSASIYLFLTIP
jgi:predicted DNA-binding transcriptional regulator AlpA